MTALNIVKDAKLQINRTVNQTTPAVPSVQNTQILYIKKHHNTDHFKM
jgi:hypothetical protein